MMPDLNYGFRAGTFILTICNQIVSVQLALKLRLFYFGLYGWMVRQ